MYETGICKSCLHFVGTSYDRCCTTSKGDILVVFLSEKEMNQLYVYRCDSCKRRCFLNDKGICHGGNDTCPQATKTRILAKSILSPKYDGRFINCKGFDSIVEQERKDCETISEFHLGKFDILEFQQIKQRHEHFRTKMELYLNIIDGKRGDPIYSEIRKAYDYLGAELEKKENLYRVFKIVENEQLISKIENVLQLFGEKDTVDKLSEMITSFVEVKGLH